MFKNLDGFKKIKEDQNTAVMMHAKGHQITIAKNALPALHRKQIAALPLHKMADGGKIVKYADGGDIPEDVPPPIPVPDSQQQSAAPDQNSPQPSAEPVPDSGGATGSWDDQSQAPATAPDQSAVPQSSGAPQPVQPAGIDNISPGSIYSNSAAAIGNQAAGEKSQADAERLANQEYQKSLADSAKRWEDGSKDLVGHIKAALTDVQNGKINPNQYMESRSTPQKVSTAIGLLLGGLSSGYTHQGNPALELINKQIDRDVEAQKEGLNNKLNVYHGYLEQYKNAEAAENMTRATQMAIYGSKLKQAALDSANPLIQARAQQATAALQGQMLPLVQRSNTLMQLKDIDNRAQQGQLSPIPPEKLVPIAVPPEHQKQVLTEINQAQAANQGEANLKKLFYEAAKETRPATGMSGTSLLNTLPGYTPPAIKGLNLAYDPLIHDNEGRINELEQKHVQANSPQWGDSDETIDKKWQAIEAFNNHKKVAPTANAFGINLKNYQSTASQPAAPDIKVVNGVRYMRGPNNQAIPVK